MLLLLTQTFSKWAVVIGYELNQDYISKNLCINKAQPNLHCNGKCQMMKKLAEEENQNTSTNLPKTSKTQVPELVFTDKIFQAGIDALENASRVYNEEGPSFKPGAPVVSIFHPPAVA